MDAPLSLAYQTLRSPVETRGVGLHTGALITARLCPRAEPGIVFVRTDLPQSPEIPVAQHHVASTTHATTLKVNKAQVSTTEHLLAALWALNVTHCRVELNGPEVPILDGSAIGWCHLIEEAGIIPVHNEPGMSTLRPLYALREPVWVSDGDGSVLGLPYQEFRLTVAVDFKLHYVGPQTFDLCVTPQGFTHHLAPARTFTLEKWIEPLRAQGLIQGGSTDNAIVLGDEAPSSPWRFPNELARHKALDVVGDIALLFGENCGILHAHIIAIRGGHGLHRLWMQEYMNRQALLLRINE